MRWSCIAAVLLVAGAAAAGEWHVDGEAEHNRVQFTSEVAGFDFTGTTDQVDGFIYWEGDSLFARASQVHFEVDLASLDTGIGKRDRDMREVLDTRAHPKAVFHGGVFEHAAVDTSIVLYRVGVKGTMSVHGVDQELSATGTIRPEAGQWTVESAFTIRLADHGIEAPSLAAFVKVGEEVQIVASFAMKRAP